MQNQSNFGSTRVFLLSLLTLFGSLLNYDGALSCSGRENNSLAENWGTSLAILLVLAFGLGWWVEYQMERFVMLKGRKIAKRVLSALGLVWLLIGVFLLIQPGFLQGAIGAVVFISFSGFFLRQSVVQPKISTELHNQN